MGEARRGSEDGEPWVLVLDGGLRGGKAAMGLVLATGGRIVDSRGYGFGVQVGSPPITLEGLLWYLTRHLLGSRIAVADSAAGCFPGNTLSIYGPWATDFVKGALMTGLPLLRRMGGGAA